MNRENKFRVWDKENKQFESPFSMCLILDGTLCFKPRHTRVAEEDPQNDRFILVQYIGFEDSSETEIYEGDILEWESVWGGKTRTDVKIPQVYFMMEDGTWYPEMTKRIGNIYENPELLNK